MEASFARTLTDGREGLPALVDAVEAFLHEAAVPETVIAKLLLVLDEVAANALSHGHTDRTPAIDFAIRVTPGRVSADVTDDGRAFDPLVAPAPDVTLPVQDRPIGGLGLLLVRKLMDEVAYTREHGCNRLRFSKDFPIVPSA